MSELKKGDRVIVELEPSGRFRGTITGESRTGEAWTVLKDGTKYPRGIHKSFCRRDPWEPRND
ncbi:MAG TPA: hypothetical protein VK577_04725 [Bradyrhizobium sp.]|nr:hypothetical protein [Bradyrhizobium sp.]